MHPNTHFAALIFSRTTRFAILCTDSISKFQENFVELFRIFAQNFGKNRFSPRFASNFAPIVFPRIYASMVGWTQSMLVGLYGHYGQYGSYGRYGSYGPIGLYGTYGRRRGAQLTNFLFVRMCILVFEQHVRRVRSWYHVSFPRFFSRSLLESAPCRGALHSSLCSQLRRSLCSQLRSSQCRA